MKILAVDDDFVSREKMKKIMNSLGQCEVVDNGLIAITAFTDALRDHRPFDLMTIDISMPEMDGTEVLLRIREIEDEFKIPKVDQVKVMMVTSISDKDTIVTCVQAGCNDYIVKPFNKSILINKLQKIGLDVAKEDDQEQGTVRDLVMETVQGFKKGNIDLPVLPQVIQEILDEMNKPTSTVDDLARVIEKDAVISVKLISTANSPLYRGTEKIHSVSAAVPRLGLKESQNIVSAIATKSLYKTKNKLCKELMERLWLHSLATGFCAKCISQKIAFKEMEKIFLMGLLHDIGKVLLLKTLGGRADGNESFDKTDLIESMQEVHTSFGAALLDQWGYTQDFVKITSLHEWSKYNPSTPKEVLIINLANNLARKIGFSIFDNDEIGLAGIESAKLLGIDDDLINDICEEAKGLAQDSASLF